MISVGFEKYGSQEELEKDAIKHLYDVYVKITKDSDADPNVKIEAAKWFKRMEDGDESALANWRVWRALSIKKYEEEYARLNVFFTEYIGESTVGKEWQDKALERLDEMKLIDDHEGAKLVNLEKWKMGKAVLRKKGTSTSAWILPSSHPIKRLPYPTLTPTLYRSFSLSLTAFYLLLTVLCVRPLDGTSIYLTRDIGGAIERWEKYQFDKMIYVISSQQDLHTSQFFKILKLMDFPWADRLLHVNYGLVLGMSTRKGTAVFLDQIIKEAASVMHDQMKKNEEKYNAVENPEEVAQEIGITGVKIQDMAAKRYVAHIPRPFTIPFNSHHHVCLV